MILKNYSKYKERLEKSINDGKISSYQLLLVLAENANEYLDAYTNFLVKEGYMDCDAISEEPLAINEFYKTITK